MESPLEYLSQKTPLHPALEAPYRETPTHLNYKSLSEMVNASAHRYQRGLFYPLEVNDPIETIIEFFAILTAGGCALLINARLPQAKKNELIKTYENIPSPSGVDIALFTSGSSSTPKLACLRSSSFIYNARLSTKKLGFTSSSKTLLSLPLFHVSGLSLLYRSLLTCGSLIIPDKRPLPSLIEEHSISHLSLVQAQLMQITRPLPSLRSILVGGGPTSEHVLTHAQNLSLPVHHSYGMTETTAMVLCDGMPLEGTSAILSNEGELLLQTPSLFAGYFTGEKLIAPTLIDGYFPTGDIARQTTLGTFEIIERKDRMFISGGENIQPGEIEKHLLSLQGVTFALVKSESDPCYGKVPIAYIETTLPIPELENNLSKVLPKYKIPKKWLSPRLLGGKYDS